MIEHMILTSYKSDMSYLVASRGGFIASMSCDIIKIMPCVEGDRSDCQPEASSIARSRRLRAMVVVEG